ncbi:hypothetical protein GJ496_007464 [Pomphorhynchus laevis]|nr:hypothetical protein GJ496_007464 [Pomphorhynchus laevis]
MSNWNVPGGTSNSKVNSFSSHKTNPQQIDHIFFRKLGCCSIQASSRGSANAYELEVEQCFCTMGKILQTKGQLMNLSDHEGLFACFKVISTHSELQQNGVVSENISEKLKDRESITLLSEVSTLLSRRLEQINKAKRFNIVVAIIMIILAIMLSLLKRYAENWLKFTIIQPITSILAAFFLWKVVLLNYESKSILKITSAIKVEIE